VGQLDDVVIVAFVLRSLLRGGGETLVREHWPGPRARSHSFFASQPDAPTTALPSGFLAPAMERLWRRSRLRLVDPHFQPGTRAACSIHLCISGPCASPCVVSPSHVLLSGLTSSDRPARGAESGPNRELNGSLNSSHVLSAMLWVATDCREVNGKEGVDGSSPSEGFAESPAKRLVVLSLW
jgi:hypothetical protein